MITKNAAEARLHFAYRCSFRIVLRKIFDENDDERRDARRVFIVPRERSDEP
jgi:hypothetical protein